MRNKIYEFRLQKTWTLQDLAKLSGVPLNTIWRMERGYGTSLRNALRVADAFQVTIYELWNIPLTKVPLPTNPAGQAAAGTLRQLRQQRNWRLHDLSRLTHVSKTTLAQIEHGHIPTLKNAVRIAAAYGVSVYHLWGTVGGEE